MAHANMTVLSRLALLSIDGTKERFFGNPDDAQKAALRAAVRD